MVAGPRRILRSMIESALGRARGGALLETGSGTGAMGQMFAQYGWFVGLDASWIALQLARVRVDCLVAGRLESLPFVDRSFDAVFACDVLEHVERDASALLELRRICKPAGKLFLTVPAFQFLWSPHDEVNRHRRRYTKRQLAALLAATNWRVDRLSYFNTLLFPPIAGVRLLGKLHPQRSGPARSDLSRRVPRPVNAVLEAVFASERHLLRRWNLPFGVSLLSLATPAA